MAVIFSKKDMLLFLDEVFPQVTGKISILKLAENTASVKLITAKSDLRPGGTVSGPSMFLLADVTFYILVLSAIGKQQGAVTTNCSINFMRKPEPNDLVANAQIFKQGRKLIVGDVLLRSESCNDVVAHASFTYSVPSKS